MKKMDLPQRHRAHREKRKQLSSLIPTPWGNADDCQNKGVGRQESCKHMKIQRDVGGQAGKAIRTPRGSGQASMKTKERQSGEIGDDANESFAERWRYATGRDCGTRRRSARKREPSA